jgi:hypothetical protein
MAARPEAATPSARAADSTATADRSASPSRIERSGRHAEGRSRRRFLGKPGEEGYGSRSATAIWTVVKASGVTVAGEAGFDTD